MSKARLERIRAVMDEQGLRGNPRRFVILWGYNRITDWDMDYQVNAELPPQVQAGALIWLPTPDTGEVRAVEVLEDKGASLWCRETDRDARFSVLREDARATPIPRGATAVKRSSLAQYIGDEAARVWHQRREARLRAANVATGGWTGPLMSDLRPDGTTLKAAVPPERWPFGLPEAHDKGCGLHEGGLFCDCEASAADGDGGELA